MALVLFDLDGTLCDPRPGFLACMHQALDEVGVAVPAEEELAACIGPPLEQTFARLLATDDRGRIAAAAASYRRRYDAIGWRENSVYPGIPELLAEVAANGWQLAVATSKGQVFAERIIAHFGLDRWLAAVHGAGPDGSGSDKSEVVGRAIAATGDGHRHRVMVGDRKFDVLGAAAHGVPTVGVLWGYGASAELVEAGAARLCARAQDVVPAIADLLAADRRAAPGPLT